MIENAKNRSTRGLSTAFLLMWLAGDIASLIGELFSGWLIYHISKCYIVGSVWAGLLPTVIAIAVYFCISDCVLLSQVFYYNHLEWRASLESEQQFTPNLPHHPDTNPTQPLLSRRRSTSSSNSRCRSPSPSLVRKTPATIMMINVLVILGTCLAGTLAWFVAWNFGVWKPEGSTPGHLSQEIGAEVLGYISALLYIGARIPQIIQNYHKRSCEGNYHYSRDD